MADDSTVEEKEQDPVEAIRSSLKKALGSLKKLFAREEEEEEELEEEIGEVVTSGSSAFGTGQDDSGKGTTAKGR